MQNVQNITQAYSQAPWRKQVQWIGSFLLVLVFVWLIAALISECDGAGCHGRS